MILAVRENLIACFRLRQPCQLTCLLVSQPISSLSTALKCLLFCLLCFKGLAVLEVFEVFEVFEVLALFSDPRSLPRQVGIAPLWVYIETGRLFEVV
jgi:hypothetical protein